MKNYFFGMIVGAVVVLLIMAILNSQPAKAFADQPDNSSRYQLAVCATGSSIGYMLHKFVIDTKTGDVWTFVQVKDLNKKITKWEKVASGPPK